MKLTKDEIKGIKTELADNKKYLIYLNRELNDPNSYFSQKDVNNLIFSTKNLITKLERTLTNG